jgi:hypothetical protein
LSEAEFRPRGRPALDRGGVSPEGASNPRLRRSFARGASSPRSRRSFARGGVQPSIEEEFRPGGVQPSIEAEFRPRGRPTLKRVGVSPEGASCPRAKRSFDVAVSGHSTEAEFCPRGVGAGCLLGHWCYLGHGCTRCGLSLVGSFAFLLLCEEMGFFLGY